jgi:hypothetical protein
MMDFVPWSFNRNAGLDGSITKKVKRLGSTVKRGGFVMKDEGLFMVDIKTPGNISGIPSGAKLIEDDFSDMLSNNLPTREHKDLIKYLKHIDAV